MHFTYCPYCGTKAVQKEIGDEGMIPYCNQCEIPLWEMFTSSIICVVVNEQNQVALIRQNYVSETHYVCVAGIMKIGESAEETVRREVKEEIGLDIEWLQYIESYPYPKKEMLMLGYKAYVKKADFTVSKEVDCAEWVEMKNALEKLREGSIAWKLVKQCMVGFNLTDLYNNIYKDIALIRRHPGMYIGKNSVSALFTFLGGYYFAHHYSRGGIIPFEPLPFFLFNRFVANYYHESACMGWSRTILEQTKQDEEKGLELFFELYDIFRSIKIVDCQIAVLTPENIQYHNTLAVHKQLIMRDYMEETDFNKLIGVPVYIHAQNIYCIQLSDNYGYLFVVEYQDAFCWEDKYFTLLKQKILDHVKNSFGKVEWNNIDKSVFHNKPIYEKRHILDEEGHCIYW